MSAMERRLAALEKVNRTSTLSPRAKQWLGLELTPDELADLDRISETDWDDVDWSHFSPEVREWLQQD